MTVGELIEALTGYEDYTIQVEEEDFGGRYNKFDLKSPEHVEVWEDKKLIVLPIVKTYS